MLKYLTARVRQAPPANSGVLAGSTPVVAFGDLTTSRVATLGWNPSRLEFTNRNGGFLADPKRRFETAASLGVANLSSAADAIVERVLAGCRSYFDVGHNPYRFWFNRLEEVVQCLDASYYDRTACHLDLAQWATNPTWRGLSDDQRSRMLDDGVPFLKEQLRKSPIKVLLINGSGVSAIFAERTGTVLDEVSPPVADGRITTRMRVGELSGVRVIAWSTNLQSSRGVTTKLRQKLGRRVAVLADGAPGR